MNEEIVPILMIGLRDNRYITCQMVNKFGFNETVLTAILNVVFDYAISNVPESEQIEFEREAIKMFNEVIEQRHNYIDHYEN